MEEEGMKRKLVSAILCGAMVLAMMTGCGSSGDAKGDKITINLYQNKSEMADQLQAAAEKYSEENPNVKINVESIQGNDYNTNLKAKLMSDDSVDIYALGNNIASMTDYVEDLSDQDWVSHAVEGSLDADWEAHGVLLDACRKAARWGQMLFPQATFDVLTAPGITPCLFFDIPAFGTDASEASVLCYGHLDKQRRGS